MYNQRGYVQRLRLLDLFCGAGGASMGYQRAGFTVIGVDIRPQPHYPFEFIQADALTFPLKGFDAIHASPPCQRYSAAQQLRGNEHPDLIDPVRQKLQASGVGLWVIENVIGAPLHSPAMLCGTMFRLPLYRHRLFESSTALIAPEHTPHVTKQTKMGRPPRAGEFMQVVGNFAGVARAREAMGIEWMSRNELSEAIPPAYTKWVGQQLLRQLQAVA